MDLNTLEEPDRIPWRIHGCFHNQMCIQVETMDNLLRKPSMHGCMHQFQTRPTGGRRYSIRRIRSKASEILDTFH